MLTDIPATIDLNPRGGEPVASVIWLHGLGADGNDFVPIVERFQLLAAHPIRFIFPHAPILPVTVNGGMKMRAWYDIVKLEVSEAEDKEGIKASARLIRLLIEREAALGIAANRIVLIGFSQGGAMALYTGLRYPFQLAGIAVLSGYLPLPNSLKNERDPANQSTPIFMAHGLFDTVVPPILAQLSREQLEGLHYAVDWHSYSMSHSVSPEEITDIERFLQKALNFT